LLICRTTGKILRLKHVLMVDGAQAARRTPKEDLNMSDETPQDETEVEGHGGRMSANDEPMDDGDDEVEGHMRASGPRIDGPRLDGPRLDGPRES
jgi:hypothetical protein